MTAINPPRSGPTTTATRHRAAKLLPRLIASLTPMVSAGCLDDPPADVAGPQVVLAPLGGRPRVEVSSHPALEVQFSEPMAAASASAVALLAWSEDESCGADLACPEGRCVAGRCQLDPVGSATWRALTSDAATETEEALEGRVPADVAWLDHPAYGPHSRLRLTPRRALAPRRRHSLLLGEGVRDRADASLVDADGVGMVGRWDFVTADEGSGGPEPRLHLPAPGNEDVDPDVARVAFELRRPVVLHGDEVVWLVDERGRRVEVGGLEPCEGWIEGFCVQGVPSSALEPDTWYRVENSTLRDRAGLRGVPPHDVEWFATGPYRPSVPLDLDMVEVSLHGPCAHLRGLPAQPISELGLRGAARRFVGPEEIALHVGLPRGPGVLVEDAAGPSWVDVTVTDLRGETYAVSREVVRAAPRPAVSITEVLANASGKESAGEFIELRVSPLAAPVSTDGWFVADLDFAEVRSELAGGGAPPGDPLPAMSLEPGTIALVVGSSFDPAGFPPASRPDPSAVLLPTSGTIASGGLRNSGEPISIYRRTPLQLIASYGDFIDTSPSALDGISVEASEVESCDVPARWRLAGAPTPGWVP